MISAEIENLIAKELEKINSNDLDNTTKVNSILNIIDAEENLGFNTGNNAYIYRIKYIDLYVEIFRENGYGYYEYEKDQLLKVLFKNNCKQNIDLIKYLLSRLKKNGFEGEKCQQFEDLLIKTEFKFLLKNFELRNVHLIIVKGITYNYFSVISSFLMFILIFSFMLLPAPTEYLELFEIKNSKYSNVRIFNNVLDSLSYFFGIDSDFSLKPLNALGMLVLVLFKIFIWSIIIKLVVDRINKILS